MHISCRDREILRELAREQMWYANSEKMHKIRSDWLNHNTFKGERPMIHIEINTFENEIIPPLLKCEGRESRQVEASLYRNFLNHKLFMDDFVVNDFFAIIWNTSFNLFNINIKRENTSDGIGHHFIPVVNDLKVEFYKFEKSKMTANKETTLKKVDFLNEIFDDILPVKIIGDGLYAIPTQNIVHFMGMENMFISMYDYPSEFKAMMDKIAEEYISYFRFMEENGLLLPTINSERLGQGSWCFTDELPDKVSVSKDVWGFMDSQETVGVSLDMFKEFIFPCYKKIAEQFGLLSYGCCEPVDPVWESCISKLPNLRKVSVSPWCNEEYMGEQLSGKRVVFHRKPSPNYLGVGVELDEEAVISHIDKTIKAAKGCSLEITQRDVYTINNDWHKVRRYVDLIRQRCEK